MIGTAPSGRTILIAGAGIAGMTAALALAARGFRITLIEQTPELQEVGAGLQIGPNATRILLGLGLGERLAHGAVVPQSLILRYGPSGREIVRMPLGAGIVERYGAPWWVVHRADLQQALSERIAATDNIDFKLGARIDDLHVYPQAVRAKVAMSGADHELQADALIGADGLWSKTRQFLGDLSGPTPRRRIAFRATVPMEQVRAPFNSADIGLWMGSDAHLVHYPVRGGESLNMVAVLAGADAIPGWDGQVERKRVLEAFLSWASAARELVSIAPTWRCWPLADRPCWFGPGTGAAMLIGDAAHAMLPFFAQGAAMGIEDAAVLANEAAQTPDDLAAAFQRTAFARQTRVAAVQRSSRLNGHIYHLGGPVAAARNLAMAAAGGEGMLRATSWVHGWRPPS